MMFAWLMGLPTISPVRLHEMIERREAVVPIDVNARESWLQARVPGALHLDPSHYRDSDLPADRDATLVFYCSNPLCRKAPIAARRAKGMGYRDVRVMAAGIAGWRERALPTESGNVGSRILDGG